MMIEGRRAQDFMLDQLDGGQISLSEILGQGRNALLVFLRHLG